MKFNVKSKDNYDKEYGINEVYQFIFGEEYLDLMYMNHKMAQEGDDDMMDDEADSKKPKLHKK